MDRDIEIEQLQMRLKQLQWERGKTGELNMAQAPDPIGYCGPSRFSHEWVHDVVTYHVPTPPSITAIGAVRLATENFLRCLIDNCPDSADRSEAIRLARTAMMTANASIVLNGRA